MSTLTSPAKLPASASDSSQPPYSRPKRLLACMLCQERKVKCDHGYPCATCVKARVHCVPVTQASRRRKRRLPEGKLLEHLRKYESLLRQHNIKFEPLHPNPNSVAEKESPASPGEGSYDSDVDQPGRSATMTIRNISSPSISATSKKPRSYEAKRILHALSHEFRDRHSDDSSDDEVRQDLFKDTWDQAIENDDHLLLFGSRQLAVDMYTLHPQTVQIFQLWQVYLENVNPLLKVTHIPTLQGRIIQAASDVLKIKPDFEALIFSIYCIAVSSLTEGDCQAMFGSSQLELLARYQLGCQQALQKSRFLRCTNRDCLTAFYLYLVSIRPNTTPHSLSSMLGIAIRIAQRMGIHSESILAKYNTLDAEMSRRLWWSLMLYDSRIGEMANDKTTTLLPTWDCRIPLNVNDSDLRQEMKGSPQIQGKLTDAIFAVVRSKLADFVRRTTFHLSFFGPDPVVRHDTDREDGEMDSFARTIEDNYLSFCDQDNPLHFMTIWTTRGSLAKFRLMEHHFRYYGSPLHQAEAQRNTALSYALTMLECNTKLISSPLTKGFIWMVNSYFPFIGYIQIVQHLKWRPMSAQATEAWKVMSDNYHARLHYQSMGENFFKLLTSFILQAWEARMAAFKESGEELVTPDMVLSIRYSLAQMADSPGAWKLHSAMDIGALDFPMSMSMGLGSYAIGGNDDYALLGSGAYPNIPGLSLQDLDMAHIDWSAMDCSLGNTPTTGRDVSQG